MDFEKTFFNVDARTYGILLEMMRERGWRCNVGERGEITLSSPAEEEVAGIEGFIEFVTGSPKNGRNLIAIAREYNLEDGLIRTLENAFNASHRYPEGHLYVIFDAFKLSIKKRNKVWRRRNKYPFYAKNSHPAA